MTRRSEGHTGTDWPTLLCGAAHKGSVKELRDLMQRGAPVNVGDYDRRTALHLAASEGMLEVVKYLVDEAKAKHSPQDRWGNTPLDDALRGSHAAVAAFLEGKNAVKSDAAFKGTDWSSLLCAAAHKGDIGELSALVVKGAPVNVGDYDRRTAIHLAASEGQLAVVKYLVIEAKAETSPEDRWGNTPLDDARRAWHAEVAEFLVSRGATANGGASFAKEPEKK